MAQTTKTYLQLQQDALTRFQGDYSNLTNYPLLGSWINDAYHYINAYRDWKWCQKTTTTTLAQGVQSFNPTSLDTYYRRVVDVVNITTNKASRLQKLDVERLDRYKPIQTDISSQGVPQTYYIWNGQIYVYPVPDGSYTFEIRYYATDADLVANTDIPNLPQQAAELLAIYGYKMILQQNFMYDQASYQDKIFQQKLSQLVDSEILDNDDDTFDPEQIEPPYSTIL